MDTILEQKVQGDRAGVICFMDHLNSMATFLELAPNILHKIPLCQWEVHPRA